MKKQNNLKKIMVLAVMAFAGLAITCPAMGATRIYNLYKMTGKIAAIDHTYNTVVVYVPLANGQVFVVGGPLATNAILKKGSALATLSDFRVGEMVVVKWSPTDTGHLIKMIQST